MRTVDVRLSRCVRVLHVYGYRARPTFHGIHFIFLHSDEPAGWCHSEELATRENENAGREMRA